LFLTFNASGGERNIGGIVSYELGIYKKLPYPLTLALNALKEVRLKEVVLGKELYERPFNYEFYHRLKVLIERKNNVQSAENKELTVHGEAYKGYRGLYMYPDIIIHVPGTDVYNLLAIEVKIIRSYKRKVNEEERHYIPYSSICSRMVKDLLKLYELLEDLNYAYGLLLIVWPDYLRIKWKKIVRELEGKDLIICNRDTRKTRLFVTLACITKGGTRPINRNGIMPINERRLKNIKATTFFFINYQK